MNGPTDSVLGRVPKAIRILQISVLPFPFHQHYGYCNLTVGHDLCEYITMVTWSTLLPSSLVFFLSFCATKIQAISTEVWSQLSLYEMPITCAIWMY